VQWIGGPQLRMAVVAPSGVVDLSSLLFSWLDGQRFAGDPATL
jgi:hypothetical protein